MIARIAQLAQNVADRLAEAESAGRFCCNFCVGRNYGDEDVILQTVDAARVDVTPMAHDEADLLAHGTIGFLARLRIGVRLKFGTTDQREDGRVDQCDIDKLIALVEEIHLFLAQAQIDGASWIDGSIPFAIVHDHLRQHRQFTAIISERFRIEADLCGEAAP